MSLSQRQIREQMIEYLYGELKGEALAQFEAALRESEQSRQELAALQATLRATRVVLARDAQEQPPARVRDSILRAAQAQLAAAGNAAPGARPTAATQSILRWLRSVWILPSLVAATAAALLVFKQDQHTLAPEAPTTASSSEVVHPLPPNNAADQAVGATVPSATAADSTSEAAAPQIEAPARSPAKTRSPRRRSRDGFASPPADWQRSPSAEPRTPAPVAASSKAAERLESEDQLLDTSAERSTLGSARRAPAVAAPRSTPLARRSAEPPSTTVDSAPRTPLTAARLEQRAREHVAEARWSQAAADYRELLRRFPQDPKRKLWTEQLERVLRTAVH